MYLRVTDLTKAYGAEPVLRGVSLGVREHETLAVLGRSGGGKTTLLRCIAGLETEDAGTVDLGGERLSGRPPEARRAVYLYQEPLLFPHLDVFENVAFAMRLRRAPSKEVTAAVDEMLDAVDLASHARKRPEQLSGGQRQRVAFGRAILARPRLLLLDEPFGGLDAETRASMQALFADLRARYGITSLFVTHDLREALVVGDAFGRLDGGRLDVYDSREAFAADPATGVARERAFWNAVPGGEGGA